MEGEQEKDCQREVCLLHDQRPKKTESCPHCLQEQSGVCEIPGKVKDLEGPTLRQSVPSQIWETGFSSFVQFVQNYTDSSIYQQLLKADKQLKKKAHSFW